MYFLSERVLECPLPLSHGSVTSTSLKFSVAFCKFSCSLFPLFAPTVSSSDEFVHTISGDRIPVHFT